VRTLCVAAFPSWPAGDFVIGAWHCPSTGVDKASLHAGDWLEIGAGHPNKRLMLGQQIRHLVSCCAGCAERRGGNGMQQLRPPGGKEKIMGPPAQLVAAGGREVDRRCS
jgi:hypothetical protein